jgi:hypothetical protein
LTPSPPSPTTSATTYGSTSSPVKSLFCGSTECSRPSALRIEFFLSDRDSFLAAGLRGDVLDQDDIAAFDIMHGGEAVGWFLVHERMTALFEATENDYSQVHFDDGHATITVGWNEDA